MTLCIISLIYFPQFNDLLLFMISRWVVMTLYIMTLMTSWWFIFLNYWQLVDDFMYHLVNILPQNLMIYYYLWCPGELVMILYIMTLMTSWWFIFLNYWQLVDDFMYHLVKYTSPKFNYLLLFMMSRWVVMTLYIMTLMTSWWFIFLNYWQLVDDFMYHLVKMTSPQFNDLLLFMMSRWVVMILYKITLMTSLMIHFFEFLTTCWWLYVSFH